MVVHHNFMGLGNRATGKYIGIYKGKFVQRVQQTTEGAIARVLEKGPNAGKTVYELYHDEFTGKLIGISTNDGKGYGKQWDFAFRDAEEVYHLNLPYSNSFAKNFLKILPNVDLTKEMKVSPSTKEVDGKNKSSLFVNQDGVALKHAYTKDAPNGLPQMVQVKVKGELVWDDTDMLEFLHNMVMTTIVPKLEGVKSSSEDTNTLADTLGGGAGEEDEF